MNFDHAAALAPPALTPAPSRSEWVTTAASAAADSERISVASGAGPQVFQQLGLITRQLHDALTALGLMSELKGAAANLPDARGRLTYIARMTGEAAEKVLTSVEQAKAEHTRINRATRQLAAAVVADPVRAVASGAVLNFVGDVEAATARIDGHLTDIMLAQDFHDLTGQVVTKVVALATDLEDSLVRLLMQVAPAELQPRTAPKAEAAMLNGPVVDATGRDDVVQSQSEVDDLLASMGF
jgi:chemotaxis protein CheZ